MTSATRIRPRWQVFSPDAGAVAEVVRHTSLSSISASLLVARGITERKALEAHLLPRLTALHDPFLLPNMDAAADRLLRAVKDGETVLVHGDYDVDGITGTALLVRLLRLIGAKVEWHIPNRFTDGYSFGDHSVKRAIQTGSTLVVSVDNGTSAHGTIADLRAEGIETIVTDHHEPSPGPLPEALIVNPKLPDSTYPFRELCGAAVAYKLAWGLAQKLSGGLRVKDDLRDFLVDATAYVAIATVCDVVPLIDENRIFARYGLRALGAARHAGLAALLRVAQLDGRTPLADDVAFKIGPRINACGRLGSAESAVRLLLADGVERAQELATELDSLNVERRRIEAELRVEVLANAEQYRDPVQYPMLVLAGQGWHQGVIGIIAARLTEAFHRPALVIGLDGETGRGSARSVDGFNLLEAMTAAAPQFERFGGHTAAAGCEIRSDNVEAARAAIVARAREMLSESPPPVPTIEVDAELPFAAMTPRLMAEFDRLAPFGEQNPRPQFVSRDLRLAEPARAVGADQSHLSLHLRRGDHVLRAMAFGSGDRIEELQMGRPIDVVFTPRWNHWRGETRLELELLDFVVPG